MLGLVVYEPPVVDIIDFPPPFTVHVPRVVTDKHLIKYSWPSIGEDGSVATSGVDVVLYSITTWSSRPM